MGKKIIIAAIIILGIFFRLYQLNTLPGGLFLDEINMAVDAKSLAQQGTDQYGHHFPFYFEDATDFKLPGYIYAATLSYRLFGNTILSMHLPSAIFGIISIFLIGWLARLLFPNKKYIGYFAAATLALSPMAIHFSRISYETNVALALTILYCIALLKVLFNSRPKTWILIGSLAILAADWTYPAPRFVIPLFTLALLFICWIGKFQDIKKKTMLLPGIFLGVVAITFIPTLLFPIADARQLNLVSVDIFNGTTAIASLLLKAQSVIASLTREWNIEFLFDKGDLFAYRHSTKEIGVFLLIFIVPFLLGIWYTIKNFSRKNFSLIFLLLFAFVAGLPSALSSEVPYGTRVLVMLIPYTLLIALGIDVCFAWMLKQKKQLRNLLYVFIGLVLFYQVGLFSYIYFVDFSHTSLPEFPTAPVELTSYITNFHASHPTSGIYFLSDHSCRTWGNDALYLWYFGNLPIKDMVAWNNAYRTVRYADYRKTSPFGAYDQVTIPSYYISSKNIYLYSGYAAQDKSSSGSLLVRCGYTLDTYNKTTEKLIKVFYMDDATKQDPYYVVTVKK